MPRKKKDKPMGQRLKEIRNEKGFSIEHVANETGFSVEYISDVEEGKLRPPVATILRLSRALEIDSGILLKKDEDEATRRRAEGFKERTESYSYEVLTPEAAYKHLKAFRVFIEPVSDHKSISYQHEGEEFIYVLKGTVEVTVGENKTILEPDHSLHFNSSIVHKLKNLSSERAETIVVLYTP